MCIYGDTQFRKKLESLFLLTWHWNKLTVWGLCLHVILPRWPFIIRFVRLCVCWGFLPAFFRVLVSFVVELEGDFGVQADAEVVVHHTLLWALSVIMKHADGLLIPDFVWVCVCVYSCVRLHRVLAEGDSVEALWLLQDDGRGGTQTSLTWIEQR